MPQSLFNTDAESTGLRASPSAWRDAGRSQRETAPLEAHAEAAPQTDRIDPLKILAQQEKIRLAELIPLRYGRMGRTPFTFLRFARLSKTARLRSCVTFESNYARNRSVLNRANIGSDYLGAIRITPR